MIGREDHNGPQGSGYQEEISYTLNTTDKHAVAGTLTTSYGSRGVDMDQIGKLGIRRLTPIECERLQGFPDNYTNVPWRRKELV